MDFEGMRGAYLRALEFASNESSETKEKPVSEKKPDIVDELYDLERVFESSENAGYARTVAKACYEIQKLREHLNEAEELALAYKCASEFFSSGVGSKTSANGAQPIAIISFSSIPLDES